MMQHLLVLSLLFTSLGASAQTVHIKIIDGRTGKMLNGLRTWVQVGHIDDLNFWKVEKEAVISWSGESYDIPTEGAPLLNVRTIAKGQTNTPDYEVCGDENCNQGGNPRTYFVREILKSGINTMDARSSAKIPFQPGVLTLYVRKITWLDRFISRLNS